MYWLIEFGSGWPPLGKPVEVEVCSLGALLGSTTVCCYCRSVLENNVKGGSCGYGNSVLVLLEILAMYWEY